MRNESKTQQKKFNRNKIYWNNAQVYAWAYKKKYKNLLASTPQTLLASHIGISRLGAITWH